MQKDLNFYTWAINNWAKASLPIAILLLILGPFIYKGVGFEAFLVYLLLPLYMFHQYEEHAHGKFQAYVNNLLGKGKEVLSDKAIFWINILAVWLAGLVGLYLSVYVNLAFGLAIGYLSVFNGLTHVVIGIVKRSYNPGLWTSLLFLLPFGSFTLVAITRSINAGILQQTIGLGFAILIHVVLVIYIRTQLSNSEV